MRTFVKISVEELKEKVEHALKEWFEKEGHVGNHTWVRLNKKIETDLKKIEFDTENLNNGYWCEGEDGKLDISYGLDEKYDGHHIGYFELSNGFVGLGSFAGGDWEAGIYFTIYWDGKQLRGYIPKGGNWYNTITKSAYGNDGWECPAERTDAYEMTQKLGKPVEEDDADGEWNDLFRRSDNEQGMNDDIMERIVEKKDMRL